jgi:hypothetical protein
MAEYLFDQYMDLAAQRAPEVPENDAEWSAFMQELVVPEVVVPDWLEVPGGDSADSLHQRKLVSKIAEQVVAEAGVIQAALIRASVPTDTSIIAGWTFSQRNVRLDGWRIAELAGGPFFQVDGREKSEAPLPVMLGSDEQLRVYKRRQARDPSLDGAIDHRYIEETSSPSGNAAILMGYALRVARHDLDV